MVYTDMDRGFFYSLQTLLFATSILLSLLFHLLVVLKLKKKQKSKKSLQILIQKLLFKLRHFTKSRIVRIVSFCVNENFLRRSKR